MILIIAEIQLVIQTDTYTLAKIWVNTASADLAEALVLEKLSADGCTITQIIETTATDKDDYFAPCTSLDAFIRAEQEHLAILYT